MSAGDAKRARRCYLEVRALGGGVKSRRYPDDPTRVQLGLFGLPAGEPQADALRERVREIKPEMIALVWTTADLDARAVFEEGTA
jgi:hypothetical protein